MGMVYKPFFCWVSSRYDRTSLCFLCWIHCFGTGKLGKNRTANFDTTAAGIYLHEGKEHIWYIMMYIIIHCVWLYMLHAYMIHTWDTIHVHKLHKSRQGPNAIILKASSQENSWTFKVNCNVFLRITFGETCDSPIKWANAKFINKGLEDVHYMWGFQRKTERLLVLRVVALCVTWSPGYVTVNPSNWSVGPLTKRSWSVLVSTLTSSWTALKLGKLGTNKIAVSLFKLDP